MERKDLTTAKSSIVRKVSDIKVVPNPEVPEKVARRKPMRLVCLPTGSWLNLIPPTLYFHRWSGVLRWYDSKINNGILEGLNSLVQAAKAKARGYRTFKNLRTIIYMITGKLDYSKAGLPT